MAKKSALGDNLSSLFDESPPEITHEREGKKVRNTLTSLFLLSSARATHRLSPPGGQRAMAAVSYEVGLSMKRGWHN